MKHQEHRPIGIFDSGCGGLTILKAIRESGLAHRFVYLGDHANGPFGNKDEDEIYELTREGVQLLFERGCRLVLLACNTASAVALRRLQEEWLAARHPDKRVLGVLIPLIEAVTQTRWVRDPEPTPAPLPYFRETIGILATPATINSDTYRREITARAPQVNVVQQACPGLADAIERDTCPTSLGSIVHEHVQALLKKVGGAELTSVILGCTHYPLVADLFQNSLPPQTRVIEQNAIVASSLKDYLSRHGELASKEGIAGAVLLTSGDPTQANKLARRFLGGPAVFLRINR